APRPLRRALPGPRLGQRTADRPHATAPGGSRAPPPRPRGHPRPGRRLRGPHRQLRDRRLGFLRPRHPAPAGHRARRGVLDTDPAGKAQPLPGLAWLAAGLEEIIAPRRASSRNRGSRSTRKRFWRPSVACWRLSWPDPMMTPRNDTTTSPDRGKGTLADRSTQTWVKATGRSVTLAECPWLEGPVGDVDVIGTDFFRRVAASRGLEVVSSGPPRGLLQDFAVLAGPTCRPTEVHSSVRDFYERTSEYDFDVWSEWSGVFRPFAGMLASIFSRRLQQLNVPLSPLDTKLGITSQVLQLRNADGRVELSAWVRETVATGRALYVGSYSSCQVPGFGGPCVK